MRINDQELNIEELVKFQETSFLKRRENGLLLSDEDISILKRNGINYLNYNNLKSLLIVIEEVLENEEILELEELSIKLGEYNYYNYTNK